MNDLNFNRELYKDIERIVNTLSTTKAKEYTVSNQDRFHNFRIGLTLLNLVEKKDTIEFVMYSYASKHFASIIDILNGKEYNEAMLNEKFTDMVNYLLLIKNSLLENIKK